MKQLVTPAIVLHRTDFGEADRILTLLTPEYGKLRLIAKGVRRIKSKLAGGIELFSVSDVTFIKTPRSEIGTVISTRLGTHYGHIVQDLTRTMLGYELIALLNKATEDQTEPEYFALLENAFKALNTLSIAPDIIASWFRMQVLRMGGHMPNLQTEANGQPLDASRNYRFDTDAMAFEHDPASGMMRAQHIKFLRLAAGPHLPEAIASVQGTAQAATECLPLIRRFYELQHRV